jgi:hypothetical protein
VTCDNLSPTLRILYSRKGYVRKEKEDLGKI